MPAPSSSCASPALSRRAFTAGALATLGALAAPSLAPAPARADDPEPVSGGTFKFYITSPSGIEPFSAEENQGVEVCWNLFDTLVTYDYRQGKLVGMAADSWDVSDDATQFTFHLHEGATFHNGQPVTSKDYKYAWERLCRADFQPAPSTLGYKLSPVKGADEMMEGTADELDVECPDDYTLVVNLKAPYADFAYIVCDQATSAVPVGRTDTEEDFQAFSLAPVGNGPFQMDGKWEDGQYIVLKPYEGYWGAKPNIDALQFIIVSDIDTAWIDFQAGNLDFTEVPGGRFEESTSAYGVAGEDGYLANPGEQTINGSQNSVYYLLCNAEDEVMGNVDVRRAVSFAINRQAICDTVCQGTRVPADNVIAPGVPGYEEGVWECSYDPDKAAELLDGAGYAAGSDGKRGLSITLSCNSGGGHEEIMQMIQADLTNVGIDVQLSTMEWAAYLSACKEGGYQIGRMGWIENPPYMDAVMYPLFHSTSGDNMSHYANADIDAALEEARTVVDDDERIAAFQKINRDVAAEMPVIPLMYYLNDYVVSSRVHDFYLDAAGFVRLTDCWLDS